MPVWAGLLALLGWNVRRHLVGKSTLCSTWRRHLPRWTFVAAWAGLTSWLPFHVVRGYIKETL